MGLIFRTAAIIILLSLAGVRDVPLSRAETSKGYWLLTQFDAGDGIKDAVPFTLPKITTGTYGGMTVNYQVYIPDTIVPDRPFTTQLRVECARAQTRWIPQSYLGSFGSGYQAFGDQGKGVLPVEIKSDYGSLGYNLPIKLVLTDVWHGGEAGARGPFLTVGVLISDNRISRFTYYYTFIEPAGKPPIYVPTYEDGEDKTKVGVDGGAKFTQLSGEIYIVAPGGTEDDYTIATPRSTIVYGSCVVIKEDSECIITFADLSTARFKCKPGGDETIIYIPCPKEIPSVSVYGYFLGAIKRVINNEPMEIRNNLSSIGIKGTKYIMNSTKDKTTVKVLEGVVEFSDFTRTKSVSLSMGQSATATLSGLSDVVSFDVKSELASWGELAVSEPASGIPAYPLLSILLGILVVVLMRDRAARNIK